MADSPELIAAKCDGAYLCRVLGIDRNTQHGLCPICKDKCMRVTPDKKGSGVFLWQCMKGCGQGTVIDALMIVEGKSLKDALAEAARAYDSGSGRGHEKQFRQLPTQPQEVKHTTAVRAEPVLDIERATEFVKTSHGYLMDNLDLVTHFKRGISETIIKKYQLGFIENVPLKWRPDDRGAGWNIPAAWVLPVTSADGKLRGIKLHFETRPLVKGDASKGEPAQVPCNGKSRWAPFGTEPKYDQANGITPIHSYYGLWPHPDTLEDPRLGEEFSSDITWWINRIPEGELRDEWDREVQWQRDNFAYEVGKTTDELDGAEHYAAMEKAFSILRDKIHAAVGKKPIEQPDASQPEPVDWKDFIFITPGELKAFAILSTGLRATAVTSGESWIPPPEALACFKGLKVCIFYDDDPPRHDTRGRTIWTGRNWAKQMATALIRAGARAVAMLSGGTKESDNEKHFTLVPL